MSDVREIPLTKGYVAIVDACDYEAVSQFKWRVHTGGDGRVYVRRNVDVGGRRGAISLHRVIANPSSDQVVDHIDGDGLNNTRANLRVCLQTENARNRRHQATARSPFKGVKACYRKWEARITVQGRYIHLGMFATEVEAARAYDAAASRHFGEFAHLNFPEAA